jgi:hypothetical protein
MFDFLDDLAKGVGSVVGAITGTITGLSSTVIATTLGITVSMVEQALKAGCTTYEEIRKFHSLK